MHVGSKMNFLDFEVKRSKVKVTTRLNVVKNHLFKLYFSSEGVQ